MPAEDSDNSTQEVIAAKKITMGLLSQDYKVRKQTFIDLQNFLNKEFTDQDLRNIFTETHMYTLNGFRDKSEAVREQAIHFMSFLIVDKLPLNDFYLTYVFPVIVERIGSVEIVEESEEIRLQLLEFLHAIISKYSNSEQLKPFLNDSTTVLAQIVKDKYPTIKEVASTCIVDLAYALPRDFHLQAITLVKPVLTCFGHQRYKVRVMAIKAIGEIVMHSSYEALNDSVGPMAERLFDQIPSVRRIIAQVAARWLREYRDRYSFFPKILPLLLTGLNDEVEETRMEAHQLWEKVGLQYQQENEKDLKDQIDFLVEMPKYYPDQLNRPNLGCRVLVQRNVSKLTKALAYELTSWQEDIRVRCSQLLCALVLHAESGLTQHLQELLPAMYSTARDQDQRVVLNIIRASEILGLFVPTKTWYKLVLPAIEDGAHYGHLSVLAALVRGVPQEYISNSLEEITKVISDDSICFNRKKKMQLELVKCVLAISDKYSDRSGTEVAYHLFKIVVALIALKDDANAHIVNLMLLEDLRKVLRMENSYKIWSTFVGRLLKHIQVEPTAWTVVTSQRCIFETILLESNQAFGENLQIISEILVEALDTEADAESRLKTFWALSTAFENKRTIFEKATNLAPFFDKLILDVFVPSLVWHAGLTAEAMRSMTASCLLCALTPTSGVDLFPKSDTLRHLFDKLLPLLLSLMEDAAHKSRHLAMECIGALKMHAVHKDIWQTDDLVKIYPEILKRLDDPTEAVRVCALRVLPVILEKVPDEFKKPHYQSHHELIVDTLLIHFDDDDEAVRNQVFDALKTAATINDKELVNKIQRCKSLVRNQEGCDNILDYVKELHIN